ncbi:outer dense fiber protein 4 isoform X1 [Rattus norvegicus]|uniref:Outer dense fiber protein 4 n=3 Tax=Rattus norvegicus TaxID=10116 RepID=A0A8L2Q2Z7_RAT|nr:outer dense fiber protein 4 isoform X1 [Rattus norvegicus]|eukprot:XP_006246760.1 PREDICTED: outer dense fiber protein 4 isoform X1 [Rattus norvegicus]
MESDLTVEESETIKTSRSRRPLTEHRRHSLLPLQWKLAHSSRWMAQVVASEFSLLAFLLLLLMVFSKKWLYPSKSRFHQRYPQNITKRVYTSIHSMSTGLLYICISKSCLSSDNEEDNFKMWTIHPAFGVAKISFILAVGLGFVLTVWLHLPYLPCLQRMPFFGLIGIILSFCEVTLIFLTLLLFPVNLWIYELKKNISVPIGWSYFIGWLVLILYLTCGILCYLNHKNFWSLIMSSSSINATCSSSVPVSLMNTSQISKSQADILDPTQDDQKPLSSDNIALPPNPDTTD